MRDAVIIVEFVSDRFPIATQDKELIHKIEAERQLAISVFSDEEKINRVRYREAQLPLEFEEPNPTKMVGAEWLRIGFQDERVVFSIIGGVEIRKEGYWAGSKEEVTIASVAVPQAPLRRIIGEYYKAFSGADGGSVFDEVAESAGDDFNAMVGGMFARDKDREYLHTAIVETVKNYTAKGGIVIEDVPTESGMRCLAHALMVHLMPPKMLQDLSFMTYRVKVNGRQRKGLDYARSLALQQFGL